MKRINIAAIACMLSCVTSLSHAREATDVASASFKSVVMLVVSDAQGNPMALGTGFFVKADILATSYHVVEGASSAYIKVLGKNKTYPVAGMLAKDVDNDLVLLQTTTGGTVPSMVLKPTANVRVGNRVYAVGNPMGLEGTFTEGIVSALRKEDKKLLVQITAPISHGSSGGPVLDEDGNVIGVAAALVENGQNLNFAIPSDCLIALLSSARVLTKFEGRRQSAEGGFHWQELKAGDSYQTAKQFIVGKNYPIVNFDDQTITTRVGENPDVTVTFMFNNGKFYQYDMAISAREPLWVLEDIQNHTAEFGTPQTASSVSSTKVHELAIGDRFVMTWSSAAEHVIYVVSGLPRATGIIDPFDARTPRIREIRTALHLGPPPIQTKNFPNKPSEATR